MSSSSRDAIFAQQQAMSDWTGNNNNNNTISSSKRPPMDSMSKKALSRAIDTFVNNSTVLYINEDDPFRIKKILDNK